MNKPLPTRKKDVLSKLEYATHRHQQLMGELFESKRERRDPAFLVHTAADIIVTVRECFDYLGQDIIDCYIVPNTQDPRVRKDHAAGKLKAYFPYYESQVTRADSVFNELSTIAPPLFSDLVAFANAIASGASIPNTLFTYQMLLDVKDMVNEKKHDKLIGVVSDREQEFLIENENFKAIIPIKGQSGWSSFSVVPGTQVSKVTEYRFEYNDQEVGKFCLFSTNATRAVILDLYAKHFA
ncbi:MAG: hypothetical protein AABZ25_03795 [Nitrospirota bacterium]